jgi:hypothetical protein
MIRSLGETHLRCGPSCPVSPHEPSRNSNTRRIPSIYYAQHVFPLALEDFAAHDDIRSYLRERFSGIRKRRDLLMRDVPILWPSPMDLEKLVHQSEGLFIYVSTLLKFVMMDVDFHKRSCRVF